MKKNLSPEPLTRTAYQAAGRTLLACLLTLAACVLFISIVLKMGGTAVAQSPSPTPTPTATPPALPGCSPTLTPPACEGGPAINVCTGCRADPSCTPPPWPVPSPGDGPAMTPIPDAFQHQTGSTLLQWRVYTPDDGTSGPWPAVVVAHGGGFTGGSPFQPDVERVCEKLALRGFCVFNVGYRLASCGLIPGQYAHDQTSTGIASGRPPQQTDDLMSLVLAARADSRVKNHKVGVLGISSGGCLATYLSLYTGTIAETGRPQWNQNGNDDRPDCTSVLSGVYDLADQIPADDNINDVGYIQTIQNYTDSCDPDEQRAVSPVWQIDANTKNSFKPLLLINAVNDRTVPGRVIFDMQCALSRAHVNSTSYTILQITDGDYETAHALKLWPAPVPDSDLTVGEDIIHFFQSHLN